MSQRTYERKFIEEEGRFAYQHAEEEVKFTAQVQELVPGKKVKITCNGTEATIEITPDATSEEWDAIQALVDSLNEGGDQ